MGEKVNAKIKIDAYWRLSPRKAMVLTSFPDLYHEHQNEEASDDQSSRRNEHGGTPYHHEKKEKNDIGHTSAYDRKGPIEPQV